MLLDININYLANLRNSIGGGEPDILKFARYCEHSGADGIVVHVADGNSGISFYDVKYIRQHLLLRMTELHICSLERMQTSFLVEWMDS